MEDGSTYTGVLILTFFAWVIFGRKPGPGENVSLMRLCVGTALVTLISLAGLIAISFSSALTGTLEIVPWLNLVVAAMAGIALAMLALGRAHDAGMGRGLAALGIIPVLGLWLMFAAPAQDPARPKYTPRSKLLRFIIGLTSLVVAAAAPPAIEFAFGRIADKGEFSGLPTEAEFAAINANLPQRLDEWTVLERVDYDLQTKEIFYRHTLELPVDVDTAGLGDRIRVNAVPSLCGDPQLRSMMYDGFALVYTYRASGGDDVPGFVVRLEDCL